MADADQGLGLGGRAATPGHPGPGASDGTVRAAVRKRLRRGHEWTTADTAFEQVAEQCRVGRVPRWLTDPLLESLIALHEKG